jgi:hypothetical protein
VRRSPVPEAGGQVPGERGEAGGVRGRAGRAHPRGGGEAAQGALLLPHLRPGRPGGRRLRLPRHQRQRPWRRPRRRRRPLPPRQLLRPHRARRLPVRIAIAASYAQYCALHACISISATDRSTMSVSIYPSCLCFC